jgi:hypothetical protein
MDYRLSTFFCTFAACLLKFSTKAVYDNAKSKNQLGRQEAFQADRQRKNQAEACLPQSYSDQENHQAEAQFSA